MAKSALPKTVAAVDLGSNSFHAVIARPAHGRWDTLDRLRDGVRLGAGLDASGRLDGETRQRALESLSRFGQRLRDIPARAVRAVGTQAFRRMKGRRGFLDEASEALGHAVEIVSGDEEARLIYSGVAQERPTDSGSRLVLDIGGGSTELILGEGPEPSASCSVGVGCVVLSRRFFPDGRLTRKGMKEAVLAARSALESHATRFQRRNWRQAVGSSGTVLSIAKILQARGGKPDTITRKDLLDLRTDVLEHDNAAELEFDGLSAQRAPVFPGGLAALVALFKTLDIEELSTSRSALREGLLLDLLGRLAQEDVRERSVAGFARRHHVDDAHAARVERMTCSLHAQVAEEWDVDDGVQLQMLTWAARLHEVGLTVAHSRHHVHGAYLVKHSDLPGFSREEQATLALLVRHHRRGPARRLATPNSDHESMFRLSLLLRLGVLLNRGRAGAAPPTPKLAATRDSLRMSFPEGWLDEHPLTCLDLVEESERLSSRGFQLRLDGVQP